MHWIPMILALFLPATALPRAETDDNLQKRDCLQSDQMLQLLTENKNRNSICAEFMDARNPTVSMFSETETAATILVTVPAETSTHTLRQTELHTNTQFESATITGTALPPPPTIVMNTVNYYEPSTVTVTQTSRGTTTITSIVTSIFTSYTSITASLPPGVGARSAPFDEVSLPSTPTDMDLPLLFPRQIDANATITSACSCLRLPTPTTTFTVTTKMTPPAVTVYITPIVVSTVIDVVTDTTTIVIATNPTPTVMAYVTRTTPSGTTTITVTVSSIQSVTVTTVENILDIVVLATPA